MDSKIDEDNKNNNSDSQIKKKGIFKSFFVFGIGLLSAIYLINPSAGLFEFIPDNIPIFGNLDEATITAILISCFSYFNINLGNIFGKNKDKSKDVIIDIGDK